MDDRTLGLYLSRILSGYHIFIFNNKKYKLIYPDISVKYEAEIYSQEEFDKNKYNDWITEEELVYVLIDMGIWTLNGDYELEKLEGKIEDAKIDLYKSYLNPKKSKSIQKTIDNLNKQYNRLYNLRHSLDHITVNGYCNQIKNEYIIMNSIYDLKNNPIFKEEAHLNTILLKNISEYLSSNNIDIKTFKTIARSSSWRNYWGANKNNLFEKPAINWTDEQRALVIMTKMYDNVYEHPDCPADIVIENDDMLDGWMISQKREIEKEKNKHRIEKTIPKHLNNAQEVFLMAGSKEEAQSIYSMNDTQSMGVIKERKNLLKQQGTISEQNLPDVKRDLILQSNEKRKQMTRK